MHVGEEEEEEVMGLHAISEDTIQVHCHNPSCAYHNCANWDAGHQCAAHDAYEYVTVPAQEMQQRMQGLVPPEHLAEIGDTILMQRSIDGRQHGETRQIPLDHPEIEWTGPDVVGLPACECGTRMFVKVHFTEEELKAPNIQKAIRDQSDPTKIIRIEQHPMVERHQKLAEKLKALGKHPPEPVQVPIDTAQVNAEPTLTPSLLAQIEELLNRKLQEHGVITTPRMPAIQTWQLASPTFEEKA